MTELPIFADPANTLPALPEVGRLTNPLDVLLRHSKQSPCLMGFFRGN